MANAEEYENKKRKLQNVAPEYFLNLHLQETVYGNIKKCFKCLSNSASAVELKEDDDYLENSAIQFSDLLGQRRNGKVWICQTCFKGQDEVENQAQSVFKMKRRFDEDHDTFTFYPALRREHEEEHEDLNEVIPKVEDKFAFPSSIESLESFDGNEVLKLKSLSSYEVQKMLHSEDAVSFAAVEKLYENQLKKYQRMKEAGDMFSAQIIDKESRIISHLKQCDLDKRIVGSSSHKSSKNAEVQWKMSQFGSNCLFVEVDVPYNSSVEVTVLVNEGKVITVSYEGNECQELRKQYHVHGKKLL